MNNIIFLQEKRFDCSEALKEGFLNYGRKYFHANICPHSPLHCTYDEFEPLPDFYFVSNYEKHLQNVKIIKSLLFFKIQSLQL